MVDSLFFNVFDDNDIWINKRKGAHLDTLIYSV